MTVVERVGAAEARRHRAALVDLLVDSVRNGASIGFLWPLSVEEAGAYWDKVFAALDDDWSLWIARESESVVGTVQLERCRKSNGRHRAELMKLFVHSAHRGRGISKQLLAAAEKHAREIGCSLLVLDTEAGSLAEGVYQRDGWRKVGDLPGYALTPDGRPHATAYHYKDLSPPRAPLALVRPAREHLPGYIAALKSGWSFTTLRGADAIAEALAKIDADPDLFLELQIDREAKGGPVTMPDGTKVTRIPGFTYWMWDGEFCGVIGFRWQPGTTALPPYTLGHIGYSVVPWKRQRGYATRALGLMLEKARGEGLEHVDVTTDLDNTASQRTIVANGGVLVERFQPPKMCGDAPKLRYRIALKAP